VPTFVPLLSSDQISRLPDRAREVVEYRKSGLSLNHIQGCPLDCAYCIRHTYGLWDQRVPRASCASTAKTTARKRSADATPPPPRYPHPAPWTVALPAICPGSMTPVPILIDALLAAV
jgi:DNA repair photolyase